MMLSWPHFFQVQIVLIIIFSRRWMEIFRGYFNNTIILFCDRLSMFQADELLLNGVDGLNPDSKKHQLFIDIEKVESE